MKGIKYLRTILNITARDLADQLGVTPTLISKWESGTNPISQKRTKQISELYQCSEELLSKELTQEGKDTLRKELFGEDLIPDDILQQVTDQSEAEEFQRDIELKDFIKQLYDAQRNDPKLYELLKQIFAIYKEMDHKLIEIKLKIQR